MKPRYLIPCVLLFLLFINSHAFPAQGQTSPKPAAPKTEPQYSLQKVKVGERKIPITRSVPCAPVVIPARGLLGLVPFTDDTTRKNAGLSAASELEHYFTVNRAAINTALKAGTNQCNSTPDCLKIVRFTEIEKLKQTAFIVEPVAPVIEETPLPEGEELEKLGSREKRKIREEIARREKLRQSEERRFEEAKKLYQSKIQESQQKVDFYITGHVLVADPSRWIVLLTVLDASTHAVTWSQRISATDAEDFARQAAQNFIPHEKVEVTGSKIEEIFVIKRVPIPQGDPREPLYNELPPKSLSQWSVSGGPGLLYRPDFLSGTLDAGLGFQWENSLVHRLQLLVKGGFGRGSGGAIFAAYELDTGTKGISYQAGFGAGIGQFSYSQDTCTPADGETSPQCYRYFLPVGLLSAGASYHFNDWSAGPSLQLFLGYGEDYNNAHSQEKYFYSLNFIFQMRYHF